MQLDIEKIIADCKKYKFQLKYSMESSRKKRIRTEQSSSTQLNKSLDFN